MNAVSMEPGFFDSYNARFLEPADVAKTFVPSVHFRKLAQRSHCALIGPRGSGKTTLLKMLQPKALDNWCHSDADFYRQEIDYSTIFVGCDQQWREQLNLLSESLPESRDLLSRAAVTTQVLYAFIRCLSDRTELQPGSKLALSITYENEAKLVKELAHVWKLTPRSLGFNSLKESLSERQLQIGRLCTLASIKYGHDVSAIVEDHQFLLDPMLNTLLYGIEVSSNILGSSSVNKWALAFDELEIAPDWLVKDVSSLPRSSDDRLLFKLSISPYRHTDAIFDLSATAPMAGHDYEPITLWFGKRDRAFYQFCEDIFEGLAERFGFSYERPEDILGTSIVDEEDSSLQTNRYKKNSAYQRRFLSLYVKDNTFKSYLDKHEVDPNTLIVDSEIKQASVVRKVTHIVLARDEFRMPEEPSGSPGSRSRKALSRDYSGARSLFSMSEGNPRWLIGILTLLFVEYSRDGTPNERYQMRVVETQISRFRSLLKTIEGRRPDVKQGVVPLLDKIGNHFYQRLVVDDFSDDPVGSFVVDDKIDVSTEEALGQALNQGAIVWVQRQGSAEQLGSLKGERFRLAYIFAPFYKLPLRTMRSGALSSILLSRHPDILARMASQNQATMEFGGE